MSIIIKIFCAGVAILLAALIFNILATQLSVSTWYDLVKEAGSQGFLNTLKNQKIIDLLSLFIIYPLLLGSAGYLVFWLFEKLV